MKKTFDEKGRILINGISFLYFNTLLWGFNVVNEETKQTIPRFELFWKGLTIDQIKSKYKLVERKR